MADKASKKPAAKQAAKKDPFAEPDNYEGVSQPAAALSPEDSLRRDEEHAKDLAGEQKVAEKRREELREVREQQSATLAGNAAYEPVDANSSFVVVPTEGKGGKGSISGFIGDNRLHLSADGDVVLDRDAVANLRQRLDDAFQATT